MTESCYCEVDEIYGDFEIIYCPKHAAADAMYEVVKAYNEKYITDECGCDLCILAANALALADGLPLFDSSG